MAMDRTVYKGWEQAIRLSNGSMELVVTTQVGPRIVFCGFSGGRNLLKNYEEFMGRSGGDDWCIYGGHRLWHAPEVAPRTYAPDNDPVDVAWDEGTLHLRQAVETTTGIRKEIDVTLDEQTDRVTLTHCLFNENPWAVTFAPWCLTVMAEGGRAILPQEDYRAHEDYLQPARPLVLWHYTDLSDPRWTFSRKYIQLHQDPRATTKQKIGLLNKQQWAAYERQGDVLIKRYAFDADAAYPDYGCNTEVFTDPAMLELETLGALQTVAPGECAVHVEEWSLHHVEVGVTDDAIDAALLPLL